MEWGEPKKVEKKHDQEPMYPNGVIIYIVQLNIKIKRMKRKKNPIYVYLCKFSLSHFLLPTVVG